MEVVVSAKDAAEEADAGDGEPEVSIATIPMAPELLSKPEGFDFYQAVVILRWIVARLSVPNKIRFRALFSLAFASSDLVEVNMPSQGGRPIDVVISFLGLGSPGSVLPMPYLEQLLEQQKQGEKGTVDFLGIFNDRLIFLLVKAKMRRKLSLSLQTQGISPLTRFLSHLAGPVSPVQVAKGGLFVPLEQLHHDHGKGEVQRPVWPQLSLLSSLMARRIASARSLGAMLSAYSGLAVKVQEFYGGWQRLAEHQWTVLGPTGRNRNLGHSLVLGCRVWLEEVGLSILFDARPRGGGMTWLRDLPRLRSLVELVGLHLGNRSVQFNFVFLMGAPELEKIRLGKSGAVGQALLGWTTVLHSRLLPESAQFVISYTSLSQLARTPS